MAILENLNLFKTDIKQGILNAEEIFEKYFIEGPTYFFQNYYTNPLKENLIKAIISKAFSVNLDQILIVGSAKLGFSLKPKNLFNEFDLLYTTSKLKKDKSDHDIAVVSSDLYEKIGKELYNYTAAYQKKWMANEYYSKETSGKFPVPICYMYFEYYTKGWFRPDFKPQGFEFCSRGRYEDLKRKLYNELGRKIGIAIYQDSFYFKDYHISNIKNLRFKLNSEKI
jgi:hypothetical protein